MEPDELRQPQGDGGDVAVGGHGLETGPQAEARAGGVPQVQGGKEQDPTQEECREHQKAVDNIQSGLLKWVKMIFSIKKYLDIYLHVKIHQYNSGGHKWSAGLH